MKKKLIYELESAIKTFLAMFGLTLLMNIGDNFSSMSVGESGYWAMILSAVRVAGKVAYDFVKPLIVSMVNSLRTYVRK